jgi:hypothetical protein
MSELTELVNALRLQGCTVSETLGGLPRYWITLPSEWTYLLTSQEILVLHGKGRLNPAGIQHHDNLRRRIARRSKVNKTAQLQRSQGS